MLRRLAILSGVLATLYGCSGEAIEERVRLEARFVSAQGAPLAGTPVRIVVGDIPGAREPSAGATMTTDGEGRVELEVTAPVKTRRISLDNVFSFHRTRFLEIGIELELRGRPALYWIELDAIREGTVGLMKAYVAGPDGRFDRLLDFDPQMHGWTMPGDPQGLVMSSIGADLKAHEMEGAPGGGWTARLTIEKHEFTMR